MESMATDEFSEVARLVDMTSDAIVLCRRDGTILHVNHQMAELASQERDRLIGQDIKDLLYSEDFERAGGHRLPFSADGLDNSCMLKLPEGSFIHVRARAGEVPPHPLGINGADGGRLLVVIKNLEERYAYDRQTQRLFSELQAVNRRLSGTLSVIMTAAGSKDLVSLLDAVLNKIVETLDADGSSIYFAESGGFKLRGLSYGLARDYVPEFIPFGAGIPTYVLREQRACNLAVTPSSYGGGPESCIYFDLDTHETGSLRMENMPPYRTLIAVPVFFGTQVLGILELGWKRPRLPRGFDARVLEVVCDYLSIELVGVVSSLRSQRTEELTRSLNRIREVMYSQSDDRVAVWREMDEEIHRVLRCRTCRIGRDEQRNCYVIDFEGGSRVCLPGTVEEMFLSVTAPAARVDPAARLPFERGQSAWSCTPDDLKAVRLVRVDATSWAGEWLASRGLPSQGVFFDMRDSDMPPEACGADDSLPEDSPVREGMPRMILLLRDGSQEPIDDIEYDYLVRLAHDFEIMCQGMKRTSSERRIAQTLQVGMRNDLGRVPGITADSLYSSATQQALVGGDFYTLIRLPDDRAVIDPGRRLGQGGRGGVHVGARQDRADRLRMGGRRPAGHGALAQRHAHELLAGGDLRDHVRGQDRPALRDGELLLRRAPAHRADPSGRARRGRRRRRGRCPRGRLQRPARRDGAAHRAVRRRGRVRVDGVRGRELLVLARGHPVHVHRRRHRGARRVRGVLRRAAPVRRAAARIGPRGDGAVLQRAGGAGRV